MPSFSTRTATDKVRFAVVGCGHIGKRHAEMIRREEGAELVALCDILPRERLALEPYADIPLYPSIEELLARCPEADVINICTPNGLHAPMAIRVLGECRHVVIEKPMALTVPDARRIIDTAGQNLRHVFCVMQNRYSPPSIWLKEMIDSRRLGEIYLIQLNCYWNRDERYYHSGTWHGDACLDGGTLFTQFSHFIDILCWLFGDFQPLTARFADFNHATLTHFEDSGIVTFELPRHQRALGVFTYSTAVWDRNHESSLLIVAQNGTVKVGGQYMNEVTQCHVKDYAMPILPPTNPGNDYGAYTGSAQNHHYVIRNVVRSITHGEPVATTAAEGLQVVEAIRRIYDHLPATLLAVILFLLLVPGQVQSQDIAPDDTLIDPWWSTVPQHPDDTFVPSDSSGLSDPLSDIFQWPEGSEEWPDSLLHQWIDSVMITWDIDSLLLHRRMDHFHHWVGTDDIPSNPLFLPLVYRTGLLLRRLPSLPEVTDLQPAVPFSVPRPDDPLPARTVTRAVEDSLYLFFILHRPQYFRYTTYDIPDTYIIPDYLAGEGPRELPLAFGNELRPEDLNAATLRFIPDRRYWRSAFESAIHFTQAWISPNWHKGGTGNLNLLARNLLKYDYNRDKIQFTNELEIKLNAYTAPKDTLRNYKIGEDLTRLHSNFGYRAFNKWYYTFDAEVRTQLFSNFAENTRQRMAATLSPIAFNFGIGMKYGHTTNFSGSRHRRLNLALNLAPLSYTHMYSILDTPDEIDLGRHGFHKNPATGLFDNVLRQFGSTLRADLSWQFNRNIVWQSRIYYFTSYDHVVGEFENTLTMAISRFFSTRIYLHLRFDDGVTRTPDFNTYLQANELLSFGFNYKWDY